MSFQYGSRLPRRFIYPAFLSLTIATAINSVVAQADAATPTLYGKINLTLDQFDHQGAARVAAGQTPLTIDQWELNSNASRLGIKGELALEDSGLTLVYLAEYETDADDGGNSPFTQRNIYAGLQGNFGRIFGGKFDTPLKVIEGRVDQFNDLKADIDVLLGGQNRANNIVQYSTPKFARVVTANVAAIAAEGADVDLDGEPDDGLTDTVSVSLVADTGTFYGAIAYDTHQLARRSLDGIVRADIIRAVGTAKLGTFELGALVQQARDVAQGSDAEDTSYLLSGAWYIGHAKLKAQYGIAEANISDEKATLAAFGLDYSLGNKTKVFTYFSAQDIDRADLADNTFAVGLDHSF
ncbi:porin [Cellvibrio sp. ARAG 10.3]|uniref:porin n=1 Tax=Cellvibrio sp. ARAG 10.3 TaxID=3451358 RepID=UPI003F457485